MINEMKEMGKRALVLLKKGHNKNEVKNIMLTEYGIESMHIVELVIGIAVAIYVAANIIPGALISWYGVNISAFTWGGVADTSTINLVKLVPFFVILAIVLVLIAFAIYHFKNKSG